MARAPEEEGSMGSVDAITALVYPASEALLQCPIYLSMEAINHATH
jgi:hypothetical protein